MSRARFAAVVLLILVAGGLLRTMWLRADPPTTSVGVVWHDEGAWVHNARNQALWGVWRTDNWNPVFVAPVFTALEYVAFESFGVGTWQARTIPVASGLVALAALMFGLSALWGAADAGVGRRVGTLGGVLLALNFTWVMWNRAALMESTMTALIVVSWAAYAMGQRRPVWGLLAGAATVLAWFTKASAAFFAAALVADALWVILTAQSVGVRRRLGVAPPDPRLTRTAWLTLAGLAITAAIIVVAFVLPNWTEYRFYNWQMSVLRKPSYDLRSLVDRASWLPIVQDFFTRMWLVLLGAAIGVVGVAARWKDAEPGKRLLVLWLLVGLLELTVHDSGNERRYVMFLPALVALAAGVAGSGTPWLPPGITQSRRLARWIALPLVALLGYLVIGSLLRWVFDAQVQARDYKLTVRASAALAMGAAIAVVVFWPRVTAWFASQRLSFRAAVLFVVLTAAWDVGQYARWAARHDEINYRASVALGAVLAPGTLVQGKLANGMSLENGIRPVFVGRGFGNYEDRFARDDARYILTYGLPYLGRESQQGLIKEILDRYPNGRVIAQFDVDETPEPDQAWLIDKFPGSSPAAVSGSSRAPD